MKKIFTLWGGVFFVSTLFFTVPVLAQTLSKDWSVGSGTHWSNFWSNSATFSATTSTTANKLTKPVGNNRSYFPLRGSGFGGFSTTYTWSVISAPSGAESQVNVPSSGRSGTVSFTSSAPAGNYTIQLSANSNTATYTIELKESNFWAASGANTINGSQYAVEAFDITGGLFNANPTRLFTTNTSFAAMGRGPYPSVPLGDFYFINNVSYNAGVFSLRHKNGDGSGTETVVLTYDANGSSNTSLGFVRLALDATANAWILAGDGGSNLYLLKIPTNGAATVAAASVVTYTVNLDGGTPADFQNGDLCLDEHGNLYAMANANSSFAYLYLASAPIGNAVTFTRKWSILNATTSTNFGGSVNGLAFDEFGGLYLSTTGASTSANDGIYYLNPSTIQNVPNALTTVQAMQIVSASNYTDLGTNVWPSFVLPVKFGDISAQYTDAGASVSWETYTEADILQYEVEMSTDGKNFNPIGTQPARNNGRTKAQYTQQVNLSPANNHFFRVGAVELNGKKIYSNVVALSRKGKLANSLQLIPNPTSGNLIASVSNTEDQKAQILIYNNSGRLIANKPVQLTKGNTAIDLSESARVLPAGVYHISITGNNLHLQAKLLIN